MTIDDLLRKGIIEKRLSSKQELQDLLNIVERDISDSKASDVSFDWQFGIAYNAALKLATILVRGSNFRVKSGGHHMNTILMIPLILGEKMKDDSEYLDACRRKRNIVEYDYIGGATDKDVKELQEFIFEFKDIVEKWLEKNSLT